MKFRLYIKTLTRDNVREICDRFDMDCFGCPFLNSISQCVVNRKNQESQNVVIEYDSDFGKIIPFKKT